MLEFAGVMNDVDPASILTYQIEATDRNINGAAVLVPNIDGENMQSILAMFRGETSLADAPTQVFDLTTTAAPRRVDDHARPFRQFRPERGVGSGSHTQRARNDRDHGAAGD